MLSFSEATDESKTVLHFKNSATFHSLFIKEKYLAVKRSLESALTYNVCAMISKLICTASDIVGIFHDLSIPHFLKDLWTPEYFKIFLPLLHE